MHRRSQLRGSVSTIAPATARTYEYRYSLLGSGAGGLVIGRAQGALATCLRGTFEVLTGELNEVAANVERLRVEGLRVVVAAGSL
jgi:hypothetical protein